MKICTKCKVDKDEALFSKRAASLDGLAYVCKVCISKYQYDNKDCIKSKKKEYRKVNNDYIKQWDANYRRDNKDILKDRSAKRRKELKDCYVITNLTQYTAIKRKDIPKKLIEAKRIQILINRTLKEMRS